MRKVILVFFIAIAIISCSSCETHSSVDISAAGAISAPAESTEFGDVTESKAIGLETIESAESAAQPEATTQWTVIIPPANGEEFILSEDQLPTITTIDFHKNNLTSQNPTEEELSNFLCEYYFYYYTFIAPYNCIYMIPPTNTQQTYTSIYDGPFYQLDPAYIKDKSYMMSVVSSYHGSEASSVVRDGLFLVSDWVDNGNPNDLYMVISDYERITGCDPSLLNFSVDEQNEDIIELTVYLYHVYVSPKSDSGEKIFAEISTEKIQLSYLDGIWKVTSPVFAIDEIIVYPTPLRDDFGKRLTIEKAD